MRSWGGIDGHDRHAITSTWSCVTISPSAPRSQLDRAAIAVWSDRDCGVLSRIFPAVHLMMEGEPLMMRNRRDRGPRRSPRSHSRRTFWWRSEMPCISLISRWWATISRSWALIAWSSLFHRLIAIIASRWVHVSPFPSDFIAAVPSRSSVYFQVFYLMTIRSLSERHVLWGKPFITFTYSSYWARAHDGDQVDSSSIASTCFTWSSSIQRSQFRHITCKR